MHEFPSENNKSDARSTNLNEFLYFAHKYWGRVPARRYWCAPARRYGCAPARRYGAFLRGNMGMCLQCREELHALSDLLGFRDASLEFGDAFGVAWVGAEEVAAA